jgi:hypothetical protein
MPKLIDMVRSSAPMLGAMLGATGPIGAAAGVLLNSVLGLPKDATEKQTEQALANATPDQLLALKKADQDFALAIRQADTADLKIDAEDRASARARDTAANGDVVNHITMCFLAAFALGLLLLLMWMVVTQPVQETARDVLFLLVGSVTGYVTQVFNFYFGSSTGSKAKSDALAARR